MKLLCLFVLCVALCAAQPVDNLAIGDDYPKDAHSGNERHFIIQKVSCQCPKGYVDLYVQCIPCEVYLGETGKAKCPVCDD